MKKIYTTIKILTILPFFFSQIVSAQICDPNTPVFSVNLVGNPNGTWISPAVQRQGLCCGNQNPNTCIRFDITLDPSATGINFDVFSGAMPGGALYYQINCGPLTSIGTPICLNGAGPHTLTFCKPGNNINQFSITSIADPQSGTDIVINDGCSGTIGVSGLDLNTITWQSVFPGTTGAYNNYLNCTIGCDTVLVTGQAGAPSYVDYRVCGTANGVCAGMTFCDTIRVTFNPTLVVGIQPQPAVICAGMSGITLTATGTGGTPPYTFTWSNGTVTTGTTSSQIFAGPGIYTVSMQDNSLCPPVQDQVNVVSYPIPVVANAGPDQVLCRANPIVSLAGTITGTNNAVWTGGAGTFAPSNTVISPVYTPTAAEIAAGQVSLVLEANNGACTPDFDTVLISFKSFSGVPVITSQNITCNGAANGQLNASVSGSVSPYLFQLNGNVVLPPVTGLSPGNYQMLFVDGNGCDTSLVASLTEPPVLAGTAQVLGQVSCFGGSNGQAVAAINGGTPPYTTSLNGVQLTNPMVNNLAAGNHQFNITDANGCQLQLPFTITEPSALTATQGNVVNVTCFGASTGQATVVASGGQAPYQYYWNSNPIQTGATANSLAAGTYTVTITDANMCQQSTSITVTEPSPVIASIDVTNASCSGYTDGTAQALVAGGTPPYNFNWSNGSANNQVTNNLGAGTYSVTITDNAGCSQTLSYVIAEPAPLNLSIVSQQNVTCYGFLNGSAMINATGGNSGYQYYWNTVPQQYSPSASALGAGNYLASVVDDHGCFASIPVAITQPQPLSLSVTGTNVTCYGANDGTTTASVSGGVPPYMFEWAGGTQGAVLSGLPQGTYNVNVSDANNCLISGGTTITEPGPVQLTASSDTTICPGSQVNIWANATGGMGGYLYSWTHNLGTSTSHMVSPSSATSYIVNAQDSTGCAAIPDTILISIQYLEPEWIMASVTPDICEGDTATLTATITAPAGSVYTLQWSHGLGTMPGPIYTSPSDSTIYLLTLTDQCGNTIEDTARVAVHKNPEVNLPPFIAQGCPPLTVSMPLQTGDIPAGSQYFWDLGNGLTSTEEQPVIDYLSSGTFNVSLTVTSPFGCSSVSDKVSLVKVHPVPIAYFEPSFDKVNILNPIIHYKNHSFGAVSYHWTFGDGGEDFVKDPYHSFMQPGVYEATLIATNEYGCEATFVDEIEVTPDFAFYIPNAFTPDGDGRNDGFGPEGIGFIPDSYEMKIYNRWGQLIYVSNDYNDRWNGESPSEHEPVIDTYIYKITVKDIYHKQHDYNGHFSVIR